MSYVSSIEEVYVNMCPILNSYALTTAWNLAQKVRIFESVWNKIINILPDEFKV